LRLLLDTHVLLWHLGSPEVLSSDFLVEVRRASDVAVSTASVWEIAIKVAKGKLTVPDDLPSAIQSAGIRVLQVGVGHAWRVRNPPPSLATADPFDRLIYAHATMENWTLATRDRALLASGASTLVA
jgi:PIN domain nuclease of toxin-antitoxin system